MAQAAQLPVPSADWVKRPYIAADDEDALVYLWCASYLRSIEGVARGASVPHGLAGETQQRPEVRAASRAMWAEQALLVEWLLAHADTQVVCDPERSRASDAGPAVIWGFSCCSGDVVHYVSIKRDVAQVPGLAAEIARALLGDRLERPCRYTHELVELHSGRWGLRVPRSWGWDSLWLARRLVVSLEDGGGLDE